MFMYLHVFMLKGEIPLHAYMYTYKPVPMSIGVYVYMLVCSHVNMYICRQASMPYKRHVYRCIYIYIRI